MLAHVVSCFCLFFFFLSFFFSSKFSCSYVPPFFVVVSSCVEKSLRTFWLTITEGSTQSTITVESLISMIHMHRGRWHWPSRKTPRWWRLYIDASGLIYWHMLCVCACVCVEAFWRGGCKYRCQGSDVQQSQGQKHLAGIWSFLITSVSLMNPPV